MPGDMMAALGRSTVDHSTFFAHNCARPRSQLPRLLLIPGKYFAPGESILIPQLRFSPVRETFKVLGCQPAGQWGYEHGVNEHGVAAGLTSHRGKLRCPARALPGTDLVRLALERARTAQQAIDFLTEGIERHGQGGGPGSDTGEDTAFLVADSREAFLLEATGHHWVFQEICEVRAASDVSLVRQDWNRISRGLASHAIEQGWWPADGSKLDFAGALSEDPVGHSSALRRWGRSMLLLEQQSGHIDLAFLRRLLGDHYETLRNEVDPFKSSSGPTALCQHGLGTAAYTSASLVVQLPADPARLTPVWCAFGPPCITVYFPIFMEGDLPAGFGNTAGEPSVRELVQALNEQLLRAPGRLGLCWEALSRLQARFDQEAEEFASEHAPLKQAAAREELNRHATHFMQHTLEQFQGVMEGLAIGDRRVSVAGLPGR